MRRGKIHKFRRKLLTRRQVSLVYSVCRRRLCWPGLFNHRDSPPRSLPPIRSRPPHFPMYVWLFAKRSGRVFSSPSAPKNWWPKACETEIGLRMITIRTPANARPRMGGRWTTTRRSETWRRRWDTLAHRGSAACRPNGRLSRFRWAESSVRSRLLPRKLGYAVLTFAYS